MSIELSKCKHGDKLRTRCGDIAEYIKRAGDSLDYYPHVIEITITGRRYMVCEDGRYWLHSEDEPHDWDIVEILEVTI